MSHGWADTTWSIKVIAPGLVSKGFMIYPPECLPLVLHGLFWELPNRKATQGGSFLSLLRFLSIISLLDSLKRDLKDQFFSLWCQTRIYLLYRPKRSSVDHSLPISSLVIFSPNAYFSTSSKFLSIWEGISVVVRRSSPTPGSPLVSKYEFLGVSPGSLLGALL